VSKRFDALLFDAGGIFLLPDPISLGAIVHEHGGNGSISAMTRAHYAGMAALDNAARSSNKDTIDGFSWDPYRRPKQKTCSHRSCGDTQFWNRSRRCGACICRVCQ
jgi:hypothetical protein